MKRCGIACTEWISSATCLGESVLTLRLSSCCCPVFSFLPSFLGELFVFVFVLVWPWGYSKQRQRQKGRCHSLCGYGMRRCRTNAITVDMSKNPLFLPAVLRLQGRSLMTAHHGLYAAIRPMTAIGTGLVLCPAWNKHREAFSNDSLMPS